MAKTVLPVNFQDDIVNASMNGKRRYNLIQNTDGTVSLEDVTTYDQVGSNFGAGQINATNKAVNDSADSSKIIDSISDIAANTKAGMMAGALAVKELNGSLQQCFTSASNGKALVAAAISGKGISTAANASYQQLANNIGQIVTKQPMHIQNLRIGCQQPTGERGSIYAIGYCDFNVATYSYLEINSVTYDTYSNPEQYAFHAVNRENGAVIINITIGMSSGAGSLVGVNWLRIYAKVNSYGRNAGYINFGNIIIS